MPKLWPRLKELGGNALALAREVASGVRVNTQAAVFFAACALLYSGFYDISPRAGKIALGLVLLHAVHRQASAGKPTKKAP